MQPPSGLIPPPMPQMPTDQQQQMPSPAPQQYGQAPPAPQQFVQAPEQQQYGLGMPPPPQQYGQAMLPPQQQPWLMMPPPPQQTPPASGKMWAPPQVPLPAMTQQPPAMTQQPPAQSQQYTAASPVTNSDEIRSLWIGDLQYWMDENYLWGCFGPTGEVMSVKVIRNKQTGQPEGYGFIEFASRAVAEQVLLTYNGSLMPSTDLPFRLNWASLGAGQKKQDDSPDFSIFVGDLTADVTDYTLQETFRAHYPSVKGAKVITDHATGRSKGYGFVKFGDESEQLRAMTEMNGVVCSTRPMRVGPASNKKPTGVQQKVPYQQTAQDSPGESDPNNTTIFVGGLDPSVLDDQLKQVFSQFGELAHVKIPVGKRCGFVQFTARACAEQALSALNGTQIGGQSVRLSWGHNASNKQAQSNHQWNGSSGYYGYTQGYEAYGYTAPPLDPNMYYAAGYPGIGNYQQPQQ